MTKPQGYSRLQIALHWAVAALIVMQVLLSDGIKDAYRDILRGAWKTFEEDYIKAQDEFIA